MIKFYGERYIFFRLININIKVSWRMFFEAMEAIARVFERHQEFYPIVQGSFSSAPRRRRSWLLSWPVPRVVSDVYTCMSAWLLLTRSSFIPSTTLTTCAIELLSTRFVHSPFALESKLQRGHLSFEEKSQGILNHLTSICHLDHIHGCFNFENETSNCLS